MNSQLHQVIQGQASLWVPCGRHTGLLLVTANEQSTAPGDTRVRLTMGTLGTSFSSRRAFSIKIVGRCCKHFTAQLAGPEKLCIIEFSTIISETAKLTFLEFSRARFQCNKFYKKRNLSTSRFSYKPGAHFFCSVTGNMRGGGRGGRGNPT